jgi:hypothetical protein
MHRGDGVLVVAETGEDLTSVFAEQGRHGVDGVKSENLIGLPRVAAHWCSVLPDTGRVEVGEVAAFGAVGGVDYAVDEGGTSRHERAGEGDGDCARVVTW